jgi:hypothetical protein
MNSAKPPRLAEWILQEFGPNLNQEALAGDLNEAFQQGRSNAWYWRQVLAAVRCQRFFYKLLILVTWSWAVTWSMSEDPPTRRLLVMAILMAVFLAFCFVLGMLRSKAILRAMVIFFLLFFPGGVVLWLIWNFAFPRKAQGPYHLTVRELLLGNQGAEKRRMIAKLEQSMREETDPQVRQAYAESIAALQANASPAAKAMQ